MRKWELVDSGEVPGTDHRMELYRTKDEVAIRVDGRELMSSRMHGSEDALADLAYDRLGQRPRARVLIGGLGMGFTLAAALRRAQSDGEVVVAELVPAVVLWHHGELAPVAGHPLADPRASVFEGDVAAAYKGQSGTWDAILLDVDNGPNGLTRDSNDWLYGRGGLQAARTALRPRGILGVWSAGDDPTFTRRLQKSGFRAETLRVRAHGKRGRRHTVWMATRT